MVTALIVDDEKHNIVMLESLLKENCPNILVTGTANNVDSAFEKIKELNPQLVFLDIKMPQKSGFDLLRMFPEIKFEVIFVSAFNEYAIKAFEFNALGYILKPIDYTLLQKTVDKACEIIKTRQTLQNNGIVEFINTLDETEDRINKISIHQNNKVALINVKDIAFIEAKIGFCEIIIYDSTSYISSKNLKKFEDLLVELGAFVRINKSIIVNVDLIKSYTKGDVCEITLVTDHTFEVSRRKKTDIISILKSSSIN